MTRVAKGGGKALAEGGKAGRKGRRGGSRGREGLAGWQVGRGVISRRREGEMMLAGELLVLVVGEIS